MKSVIDHIEQRGFLRAKKIIKSQSEEIKSQSEELEAKNEQIGNMVSTFATLAQNLMTEQHLTALQACDALGYSEDIRDLVLPHLMN